MKKETVSNDSLKEKIEKILTPYPDPMSRNDFRIVCHIGTRTSLYLLQSGLVPCKNNGKKHAAIKSPRRMLPSISTAESPTRCATPRPAGGITTTPNTRNQPHRWSAS